MFTILQIVVAVVGLISIIVIVADAIISIWKDLKK